MPSKSTEKKVLERESLIKNGGFGDGQWRWSRKQNSNCQKGGAIKPALGKGKLGYIYVMR